jgi:hypothetical protein
MFLTKNNSLISIIIDFVKKIKTEYKDPANLNFISKHNNSAIGIDDEHLNLLDFVTIAIDHRKQQLEMKKDLKISKKQALIDKENSEDFWFEEDTGRRSGRLIKIPITNYHEASTNKTSNAKKRITSSV